jgi:hypothetical protein
MRPGIRIARGPRVAEEDLLAALDELLDAARAEPRLLERPVRVVVPSQALRAHVLARLAGRRGALAGLAVETLFGLASEIVARAARRRPGGRAAGGEALRELVLRRALSAEHELGPLLARYEDGAGRALASLRDLLDAGLEPAHAAALEEAVGSARATSEERRRARALLRAARAAAEELARRGDLGRSGVLSRASEILRREGAEALPARALLIHGFVDATGVAGDLLSELAARFPTAVWMDEPPNPAGCAGQVGPAGERASSASDRDARAAAYAARLRERFESVLGRATELAGTPARPRIVLQHAPSPESEARAVARAAREALDAPAHAVPEEIAIVLRELGARRAELRAELANLGVPFGAPGTRGLVDGPARRALAWLAVLARGGEIETDRWLSACAWLERRDLAVGERDAEGASVAGHPAPQAASTSPADLRLGLRALNAGRLSDVAELAGSPRLAQAELRLPVRVGFDRTEDEDGVERTELPHRRLDGAVLRDAVARAAALRARLAAWRGSDQERAVLRRPARAARGERLDELERSLLEDFGWRAGDEALQRVRAALATLRAELPAAEPLALAELEPLLAAALDESLYPPLGGAGGGVQLLGALEARGRTFAQLILAGVERDAFPRLASEDPLLPDGLRLALAACLPDLAPKSRSRDEERHLFAELVSSSPDVRITWSATDGEGRARARSPFVERLRVGAEPPEERAAPPLLPLAPAEAFAGPRPASELATLVALHGGDAQLRQASLAAAITEWAPSSSAFQARDSAARVPSRAAPGPASALVSRAEELAELRDRIRRAWDGDDAQPGELGPWFGLLGALPSPRGRAASARANRPDPLAEPLSITTLERLLACPWRTALERILRLEPPPELLAELPGPSLLLLGLAVHRALDLVVRARDPAASAGRRPPTELEAALSSEGRELCAPEPAALARLVRRAAEEVLAEEDQLWPGLARALAEQARPFVERALARAAGESVLGSEVRGSAVVALESGAGITTEFRADLVGRRGKVALLTDYKTGAPFVTVKDQDLRLKKWIEGLARGQGLQAAAYAVGSGGIGRYLFLKADVDEELGVLEAPADAPGLAAAFTAAVAAAVAIWREGRFVPRLVEPGTDVEPRACETCEMSDACLRGDSGARGRLLG